MKKFLINVDDIQLILIWTYNFKLINGDEKKFKYEDELLRNIYLSPDENIDVSDFIEDFMFDSFEAYDILKKSSDIISNIREFPQTNKPSISDEEKNDFAEQCKKQSFSFIQIYENIILNYSFDDNGMKNIQKEIINEMLSENVSIENYEKCAELRDKLKRIG